jgi:hypothetical protein
MIDAEFLTRARDADLLATAERLCAQLKRVTAAESESAGPCPARGGTDRFSVNVRRSGARECPL